MKSNISRMTVRGIGLRNEIQSTINVILHKDNSRVKNRNIAQNVSTIFVENI
jgi:hypothetical protein